MVQAPVPQTECYPPALMRSLAMMHQILSELWPQRSLLSHKLLLAEIFVTVMKAVSNMREKIPLIPGLGGWPCCRVHQREVGVSQPSFYQNVILGK